MKRPLIGFIGQGYVGKSYADDFERRGFEAVRYALEGPYYRNEDRIADCDIVFIAVPTPTTPAGFDDSITRSVVEKIGKGKTAVIKSTVLPGTTESIQWEYPDVFVLFSPEFLLEATAAEDASNPIMNIVGVPADSPEHRKRAAEVQKILPPSPHVQTCSAREAELLKYAHNCRAYNKIVFGNLLYDLAKVLHCNWEEVRAGMDADPMFSNWYNAPVHKGGRGAGGNCFIKDFAAFARFYKETVGDSLGSEVLSSLEAKNLELLRMSGKDQKQVRDVYGDSAKRAAEK